MSWHVSPGFIFVNYVNTLLPLVVVFSISCILVLTKVTRMTDSDVTLYPYPHSVLW